jgi:hypothetical protein
VSEYVGIKLYLKPSTRKLYNAVVIALKGKKKAKEISDEAMILHLNTLIKDFGIRKKVDKLLNALNLEED